MQWRNSPARYGALPQAFHWLTVLLVILAWVLGQIGDDLPKDLEHTGLVVHMTAGLLVLALLALRLGWRVADPVPPHDPTPLGRLGDWAANLGHAALYALLLAAPVVGIVLQFARGGSIPLFGLGAIASPWPADRAFAHSVKEVHELLANALVIIALLHAVAAMWHHLLLRDRTLQRMLPGAAGEGTPDGKQRLVTRAGADAA